MNRRSFVQIVAGALAAGVTLGAKLLAGTAKKPRLVVVSKAALLHLGETLEEFIGPRGEVLSARQPWHCFWIVRTDRQIGRRVVHPYWYGETLFDLPRGSLREGNHDEIVWYQVDLKEVAR